jgi:site-specific recombinase XerD
LCLDPSIQVTRVSNAIAYTTSQRKPKRKHKWNSVEREQKLAKKAENNKLMTLMDMVSVLYASGASCSYLFHLREQNVDSHSSQGNVLM